MTEIVAADIGGTHARFAIAKVADGAVTALYDPVILRTADFASLQDAWVAFAASLGRPLPRTAGIAVAAPIGGETLAFTNNAWLVRSADLADQLGLDQVTLVNDIAAQAHAAARLGTGSFRHVCGPDRVRRAGETITVVGPGTGLGVALLVLRGGACHVIATEGGHIGFSPQDAFEDALTTDLRVRYGRVSAERIAAGPGLAVIHAALARAEGRVAPKLDDAALWALALAGTDELASAALDRFCQMLGDVAGDLALAHGASQVVIAGGLALRLADRLPCSGFAARFVAKGRFQTWMAALPVRLLTHPQPGLYGAAIAFAQEQGA